MKQVGPRQGRAHLDIGYELPPAHQAPTHEQRPTKRSVEGSSTDALQFADAARLPTRFDNVAIACRRLERGTRIVLQSEGDVAPRILVLDHTVLEGHRFAITHIKQNAPLLSWGLPFGYAQHDIEEGNYVINRGVLEALRGRHLDFDLPLEPNFYDEIPQYELNREAFVPGAALPPLDREMSFMGYSRSSGRGVGTRNYIIVLSTNSKTGSYCQQVVKRVRSHLDNSRAKFPHIDVVSVTHTEGADDYDNLHNRELIIRTLCGFIINPNVGAALVVDAGKDDLGITNRHLQDYLELHSDDYVTADLPLQFYSIGHSFEEDIIIGSQYVLSWLDQVNRCERSEQPISALKVVLQCGGSDAFSGISGNPLAAWVGKQIVRAGGMVGMAETDELIGAETYFLQNVRNLATAEKFLATVARFKERVGWHGESAEGNPSGGNKLRGLYNITLKSLGASVKRDPEVPLDYVIDYGELMRKPGFYFMDSPGNDIESIAGQVASGANMIFFITGNGSVTNFPFVPTIKIVTTTGRFNLLSNDMDVNAGLYLDGQPMDTLGAETLQLAIRVASGQRSVGEKAGHSQVQLWRNWRQVGDVNITDLKQSYQQLVKDISLNKRTISLKSTPNKPSRLSLTLRAWPKRLPTNVQGLKSDAITYVVDRVGLILPTSLCSGQVASLIAQYLNEKWAGRGSNGVTRFVALPHTEGCGCSGGLNEEIYSKTMLGYLIHPSVWAALLLEHGCEKTHNDAMLAKLAEIQISPDNFGWASVQLDGGIELAKNRVEDYFVKALSLNDAASSALEPEKHEVSLAYLSVGMLAHGTSARIGIPSSIAKAFARVATTISSQGGVVVVPSGSGLLSENLFINDIVDTEIVGPSLLYGQTFQDKPGKFHVMHNPTSHWVETLTGLGATGVKSLLAYVPCSSRPQQANPLVPLLQVTSQDDTAASVAYIADFDLVLDPSQSVDDLADQLLALLLSTASLDYVPKMMKQGNVDFQLTRGEFGVSL